MKQTNISSFKFQYSKIKTGCRFSDVDTIVTLNSSIVRLKQPRITSL